MCIGIHEFYSNLPKTLSNYFVTTYRHNEYFGLLLNDTINSSETLPSTRYIVCHQVCHHISSFTMDHMRKFKLNCSNFYWHQWGIIQLVSSSTSKELNLNLFWTKASWYQANASHKIDIGCFVSLFKTVRRRKTITDFFCILKVKIKIRKNYSLINSFYEYCKSLFGKWPKLSYRFSPS